MKVEIRLLDSVENERGQLLEIVSGTFKSYEHACEMVVAAMLRQAKRRFGSDIEIVRDSTMFGGYYRNRQTRDCIVAV